MFIYQGPFWYSCNTSLWISKWQMNEGEENTAMFEDECG